MFKIREFAEIAQVPTSTLRYYDEIGIFKPARVDPLTGYRFYSIEQLLRLNRIIALRDLGLELTQIVQLLDEEVSSEALHGMLRLRQAKIRQQIQAEQEQLTRVEARLKFLEGGESRLAQEVILKEVKPCMVLGSYTHLSGLLANVQYASSLLNMLDRHAIKIHGHIIYIYHPGQTNAMDFDVEVAVPITHQPSSPLNMNAEWSERIVFYELPGVSQMATTIFHGSPHAIVEAYQALGIWIEANGYQIIGPCRKHCLRWSGDQSNYLTEVQYPVTERMGS